MFSKLDLQNIYINLFFFVVEMASSKQTLNQSVTGYIHSVTPLRKGMKRPYFEGVLQEKHKISKLMVFKLELHSRFQTLRKQVKCGVLFYFLFFCLSPIYSTLHF